MDAERRKVLHALGSGLVGLAALVVGCATPSVPVSEVVKPKDRFVPWYVPRKEAQEAAALVEHYGEAIKQHEPPQGLPGKGRGPGEPTYIPVEGRYILIQQTLSREIITYRLEVFDNPGEKMLRLHVEHKPVDKILPTFDRIYTDRDANGTLNRVNNSNRTARLSTSDSVWGYTLFDFDKNRKYVTQIRNQQPQREENQISDTDRRSLQDAYARDLQHFLRLYVLPSSPQPQFPLTGGIIARL